MDKKNEEQIKCANDELIGKGNFGLVEEIFSADYVAHAGGKDFTGHEFIKRFIRQLRSAIPDIRVEKIEFHMNVGDMITWQRTLSGTHQADLMGIPAIGQKVEWRDMLVTRFDGGKIAEEWSVSELAGELLSKSPRG